MRALQTLLYCFLIFMIAGIDNTSLAQEESAELTVTSLTPNVVVISGGVQNVNNIAIRTGEGIVIIDSGDNTEYGKDLRNAISKHFETDNFIYIINTHHHSDHTGGNSAFPEAQVIAHKNFRIFIKDSNREMPDQSQSYKKPELTEGGELPPPPPASSLNSFPFITFDQLNEDNKNDLLSSAPDIVFDQKLALSPGNMNIYLLYFGRAHTDNDIWVYIPKEGVLCTGDLFMKDLVPGFKGMDVENWLAAFDFVLKEENNNLDYIIPGHFDIIVPEQFLAYRDYIESMYYGIKTSVQNNHASKHELDSLFSLEKKFPRLKECDVLDNRGNSAHRANIMRIADYFTK